MDPFSWKKRFAKPLQLKLPNHPWLYFSLETGTLSI